LDVLPDESTCDQEVARCKSEKQGLKEGVLSDRQAVGKYKTDEQYAQISKELE